MILDPHKPSSASATKALLSSPNPQNTNTIIKELGTNPTCPGSRYPLTNAKCSMTIIFKQTSCTDVQNEITFRMQSIDSWTDSRHNNGTFYILNDVVNTEEHISQITGARRSSVDGGGVGFDPTTDGGRYTDLFIFTFEEDTIDPGSGGCIVNGCSESQVVNVLDYSTNYCNLRNLYCNSKDDGCPIVKYDMDYEEIYVDCWQRDKFSCLGIADDSSIAGGGRGNHDNRNDSASHTAN
jgi:hypothetical protein